MQSTDSDSVFGLDAEERALVQAVERLEVVPWSVTGLNEKWETEEKAKCKGPGKIVMTDVVKMDWVGGSRDMRELCGEQKYLYGGLGMGKDKGLPSEVIEKLKEEGDAVLHVYPGGHTCIHVRMAEGQGEDDPNRMRAVVYESVLQVYLRDCRLEEDVLRLSTLDFGRRPATGERVVEAFATAARKGIWG